MDKNDLICLFSIHVDAGILAFLESIAQTLTFYAPDRRASLPHRVSRLPKDAHMGDHGVDLPALPHSV